MTKKLLIKTITLPVGYASGLTFLVLAVGLIIINPTAIPGKGNYSLSAIDVGQADSWFFQLPDGKGVLIDGGGNPLGDFDVGEHIVSPVLWHLGYRKLEAVIATHADSDHMEGLIAVVKNFEIKELWVNFPEEKPLLLKKLLRIAEKRGVKIVGVKEKFARKIGEACFQFLSPPQSPFRGKDAANNNSAIIKVFLSARIFSDTRGF